MALTYLDSGAECERGRQALQLSSKPCDRVSPSDKVRVTHVVFDIHGGGMESLVAAMAKHFQGSRIGMSVVTLSGRAGKVGESIRPLLQDFRVLKCVPGFSMLAPRKLARCLRELKADVVHVHSGCWYKGARAARMVNVPRIIYTEHGLTLDNGTVNRWLRRHAAAWTHFAVAVSDRVRKDLQEMGVDHRSLTTIENGIDTEVFSPAPRRSSALPSSLGIPQNACIVGSVGRLEPIKAYDRLVEAFASVHASFESRRPAYLVLCGSGSQEEALKAKVRALGISAVVRFVGWVDDPVEYYRMFDVFALSSLSEGLSLSLLEAMACGAIPVVTDVGANADVLGPELQDQVVDLHDRDEYVRVLKRTMHSAGHQAAVTDHGRERVVTRFNLTRMLAEYERLYCGGQCESS